MQCLQEYFFIFICTQKNWLLKEVSRLIEVRLSLTSSPWKRFAYTEKRFDCFVELGQFIPLSLFNVLDQFVGLMFAVYRSDETA